MLTTLCNLDNVVTILFFLIFIRKCPSFSGVTSLSYLATDTTKNMGNVYASLGVATGAAEIQMEQTDMALANTLDTLRQTGASAGLLGNPLPGRTPPSEASVMPPNQFPLGPEPPKHPAPRGKERLRPRVHPAAGPYSRGLRQHPGRNERRTDSQQAPQAGEVQQGPWTVHHQGERRGLRGRGEVSH